MSYWSGKSLLLAICAAGSGLAAAPLQPRDIPPPPNAAKAAASYHAVLKAIDDATRPWDAPGATAPAAAPGWRAFFDALKGELASYSGATGENARLVSLNRLYKFNTALWGVAWGPAVPIRTALDDWLTPRVKIAWAERKLFDYVESHKGDSTGSAEHTIAWKRFVDDDLSAALASYEGAKTVQARRDALKRLTTVLASLRKHNQSTYWPYSAELQTAVDGLYNRPNLDVSADVASVAPFLSNNVVTTGPIVRDGYTSMVVAGPKTGFGLLPSDEGIAFFNSQLASTTTPITDFQQQLEQDKKGRKVAKLYEFQATSFDTPNLTINAIIRPSTGLALAAGYAHNVNAAFGALPIQGKGLARGVLAILGLNRQKLTDKVGEQAFPKIASGVVEGAQEEANERLPGAAEEQNAKLRKVLIGNNTAAVREFRITELSLRSRPENALISGKVGHQAIPDAIGADMPQPPSLVVPNAGVSADLHVSSVLSNVVAGLLQGNDVRDVENLMIVTKATEPGAPPKDGVTVGRNVDYPTFLKQIEEARAANNPKVTAIRFKKPAVPPEFAADDRGFLVILVKEFQMDVPAPPGSENGGLLGAPFKVLRFLVPTAEFTLSYKVASNGSNPPTEIDAKLEDFVPSTNSKVQMILDDDTKPRTMGPFQANIALLGFKNKLQQVPIKVPLTAVTIPGFSLTKISPLDPSGWLRVVLTPNGTPINLQAQPASNPTPEPSPSPTPAGTSPVAALPATSPVATVR
jgi:hypothetical protein